MRFFTTIAALAFAASVSAQTSVPLNSTASVIASSAIPTSESSTATTTSLTPQQTCLANCGDADICCQAACVGVPCPSQIDANATTECAAKCFQGNGTADETQAYANCQASCVSSYFLTTTGAPSAGATGAGATTGTATFGATETGSGASETGSATRSSSGSSSSASGNAAPETRAAIAGAGLFGLIIAGLAL